MALLVYSSRAFNPPGPKLVEEDDIDHTIRHGLVAAVLVWLGELLPHCGLLASLPIARLGHPAKFIAFAGYAFLQGPSTCMVRPHPAVWRVIHGIIIVYLLICVFLLFQNVHDARKFLQVLLLHIVIHCRHAVQSLWSKHSRVVKVHSICTGLCSCNLVWKLKMAALQLLYPDLGVDMPERAYGSDCRLYIQGQGINWPVSQHLQHAMPDQTGEGSTYVCSQASCEACLAARLQAAASNAALLS